MSALRQKGEARARYKAASTLDLSEADNAELAKPADENKHSERAIVKDDPGAA